MDEIKRGRVPFKPAFARPAAPPAHAQAHGLRSAEDIAPPPSAETRRKQLPTLDNDNAVAFKGNNLTGLTIDARADLPPFGYNPPPKVMKQRRRLTIGPRYARPVPVPKHASASHIFERLFDPTTRAVAKLQRVINSNPMVRAAFERATGTRVVPDGRTDGKITVYEPTGGVAVATSAMTAPPMRNFYDLIAQMDYAVQQAAAKVAATTTSNSSGSSGAAFGGFPIGPGLELTLSGISEGPNGLSDSDEEEDGIDFTAQPLNVGGSNPSFIPEKAGVGANSVDVATSQLSLVIQRLGQMYSVISGMFSKYNQASTTALNNMR